MKASCLIATILLTFSNGFGSDQFQIGPAWSTKTKLKIYKARGDAPVYARALSYLEDRTPLKIIWNMHFLGFSQEQSAKKVANNCKLQFRNQPWHQINCVSNGVHSLILTAKIEDYVTACQANAWTFKLAFEALEIPHSEVSLAEGDTSAGGHVINKISVKTRAGSILEYLIDVGFYPNILFPYSSFTKALHDPKNVGTTEVAVLRSLDMSEPDTQVEAF